MSLSSPSTTATMDLRAPTCSTRSDAPFMGEVEQKSPRSTISAPSTTHSISPSSPCGSDDFLCSADATSVPVIKILRSAVILVAFINGVTAAQARAYHPAAVGLEVLVWLSLLWNGAVLLRPYFSLHRKHLPRVTVVVGRRSWELLGGERQNEDLGDVYAVRGLPRSKPSWAIRFMRCLCSPDLALAPPLIILAGFGAKFRGGYWMHEYTMTRILVTNFMVGIIEFFLAVFVQVPALREARLVFGSPSGPKGYIQLPFDDVEAAVPLDERNLKSRS